MDYLAHLEKWQAVSHPELSERKPEALFAAGFVERYQCLHNHIWERMIRLHGTIHTLEQLREFPFDHLYGPNDMEFWRLVAENFLDTAVLILHGLVNDTGEDVLSLPCFRTEVVLAPWLDERLRDLLRQTLGERKFDEGVKSIARRVDQIRDGSIAHSLIDKQTGLKQSFAAVSFDELKKLFDAAHHLFGALSFGSGYVTLAGDLMPGTVGGKPTRTCLDSVLDAVLKDSYFVSEPERRAQWWPELRKHMSVDEVELLNELRNRVGLPEA